MAHESVNKTIWDWSGAETTCSATRHIPSASVGDSDPQYNYCNGSATSQEDLSLSSVEVENLPSPQVARSS